VKRQTIGVAAAAAFATAIMLVGGVAVTRTLMVPAPVESNAVPPPPPVDPMNAARRLSQAIRFKTVSYGEGVREAERTSALIEMFLWMERTYPYFHEDAPQEIFGESVLYVWRGTDDNLPPVLLMAHVDVAPVQEGTEDKWTHEPFSGDLADGFVWGRGAFDNKAAAIALMEAGDRLAQSNFQPRRTIMFAFGEDQESGGTQGNAVIAKALRDRGVRLAWVLDEGSPILKQAYPGVEQPVALVSVAEKGFVRLELSAKEGQDRQAALSRAVDAALARSFPSDIDAIQGAKLNVLAPYAPFGERLKMANLWLSKPFVIGTMQGNADIAAALRTTVSLANAGSSQDNDADVRAIDVHLRRGDTIESITERLKVAINNDEIEIRPLTATQSEPSRIEDINGPAYAYIARGIAETFVVPVAPEMMTRQTDSRHYLDVADAVLRFSPFTATPDDLARVHGTDERVAIADLGPAVGFYTWLIRNAAQ
jgi:carboxypeptidase PM20D1